MKVALDIKNTFNHLCHAKKVVLILVSVFLVLSLGSGIAYGYSNQLLIKAAQLETAGNYQDAKKMFRAAFLFWPSKTRHQKLKSAEENAHYDDIFQKAVDDILKDDFTACFNNLKQINENYPRYIYVQGIIRQCEQNQERVTNGQETEEITIDGSLFSVLPTEDVEGFNAKKTISQSSTKNETESDSNKNQSNNNASESSSPVSSANGNVVPIDPVIPPVEEVSPPAPIEKEESSAIFGSYSNNSIENIANSLQLVYSDPSSDWNEPAGGAPPAGVYDYDPVDIRNLYMGVSNGRLYIKWALGGTIPASRQIFNGDAIKTLTYNIAIDSDNNQNNSIIGAETFLQINIAFHENGQIWYNTWFKAGWISGTDEHSAVYQTTGNGLAHTYNSGLGKTTLVYSYPLADLANTINIGSSIKFDVWAEAESSNWHHYSFDNNSDQWGQRQWIDWIVTGI